MRPRLPVTRQRGATHFRHRPRDVPQENQRVPLPAHQEERTRDIRPPNGEQDAICGHIVKAHIKPCCPLPGERSTDPRRAPVQRLAVVRIDIRRATAQSRLHLRVIRRVAVLVVEGVVVARRGQRPLVADNRIFPVQGNPPATCRPRSFRSFVAIGVEHREACPRSRPENREGIGEGERVRKVATQAHGVIALRNEPLREVLREVRLRVVEHGAPCREGEVAHRRCACRLHCRASGLRRARRCHRNVTGRHLCERHRNGSNALRREGSTFEEQPRHRLRGSRVILQRSSFNRDARREARQGSKDLLCGSALNQRLRLPLCRRRQLALERRPGANATGEDNLGGFPGIEDALALQPGDGQRGDRVAHRRPRSGRHVDHHAVERIPALEAHFPGSYPEFPLSEVHPGGNHLPGADHFQCARPRNRRPGEVNTLPRSRLNLRRLRDLECAGIRDGIRATVMHPPLQCRQAPAVRPVVPEVDGVRLAREVGNHHHVNPLGDRRASGVTVSPARRAPGSQDAVDIRIEG